MLVKHFHVYTNLKNAVVVTWMGGWKERSRFPTI